MELQLSGNEDTNIVIKNSKSLMSLILMPRDEAKTTTNWQIFKHFLKSSVTKSAKLNWIKYSLTISIYKETSLIPTEEFNTPIFTKQRRLNKMAIHSSTIAWKIPWTEEPGRLQSMGSQRVGHNWATSPSFPFSILGGRLNVGNKVSTICFTKIQQHLLYYLLVDSTA